MLAALMTLQIISASAILGQKHRKSEYIKLKRKKKKKNMMQD